MRWMLSFRHFRDRWKDSNSRKILNFDSGVSGVGGRGSNLYQGSVDQKRSLPTRAINCVLKCFW